MIIVKADKPVYSTSPLRREGEWVTYETQSHRRHIVTKNSVTTVDNEEVHHVRDIEKRTS